MKTLFESHHLSLTQSPQPSEGVVDLLKQTILGTPGKMRYAHTNVEEKIQKLGNVSFLSLNRKDQVIGTIALVNEEIMISGQPIKACYIRYFSIEAPMRQTPDNARKKKSAGVLRSLIDQLWDSPEWLYPTIQKHEPLLVYAFVDSGNVRSSNMVESFGFKQTRSFATTIFSRFRPKDIMPIANRAVFNTPSINLFPTSTELLETNCTIVNSASSSIQAIANPVSWKIHEIPGFGGKLMRHVLPFLPLTSRLFDKDQFDFLALDFNVPEHTDHNIVADFIETMCHHFDCNKALFWLDVESQLYQSVNNSDKMGILNKLANIRPAFLYTKTFNFNTEQSSSLFNQPAFISAYHST
ncbi:MAG: hypothetical protein JXQ90_22685 [Cyclobacteriaceae bacterium]